MNEADKLLEELFADEEEELEETSPENNPQPAEPDNPPADPPSETKAFSERLKKEKEKMAKQLGYNSWDEALEAKTNDKIIDKGLDPDTIKPMLKELMEADPDYRAAMEYKKEKEAVEQKIWADNELKKLNEKFGIHIKDINSLDDNVVKLWNSGLSLEKAYAAEHYEDIQKAAIKRGNIRQTGKEHMIDPVGQGPGTDTVKKPTAEQISVFRALNPGVSDEDIIKYINRR